MRNVLGKIVCVMVLLVSYLDVNGQQDLHNTQYMFTPFLYNPAVAGSDSYAHVWGLGRLSQSGLVGEQTLTSAGAIIPFNISKYKNGFGILVSNDKFGQSKNLTLKGSYAIQFKLGEKGTNQLGVGLDFGAINGVFDKSGDKPTATSFDLGFGLYFTSNRLFSGVSVSHLLSPEVPIDDSKGRLKPTLTVMSGYAVALGESLFSFQPSFLLQTEFVATHLALTGVFDYNQKIWLGGGYRLSNGVTALAGVKLFKGLQVGYSYDYLMSEIGKYSGGSHEVFLTYFFSLKREKSPSRYKSIRFL